MPKAKAKNSLAIPPELHLCESESICLGYCMGISLELYLLTGKSDVKKPICHENKKVLACDTQHNFKWMLVLLKVSLRPQRLSLIFWPNWNISGSFPHLHEFLVAFPLQLSNFGKVKWIYKHNQFHSDYPRLPV